MQLIDDELGFYCVSDIVLNVINISISYLYSHAYLLPWQMNI